MGKFTNEVWMPMSGFENYYKVSNKGRVMSLWGNFRGKPYTGYVNKKGYCRITTVDKVHNKVYNFALHRLVALTFIPNPNGKPCINHIDGNKQNNCVENLEWVTNSENEKHSYRVLGKKPSKTNSGKFGYLNKRAIKIDVFDANNNFLYSCYGVNQVARDGGFSPGAISNVLKGNRKTHKEHIFRYSKNDN